MSAPRWTRDTELAGFCQATLRFPRDYDGDVTATLVRNEHPVSTPKGAVLYIHGFIDYFFQAHVARAFNARGYDFYALDLRKYGRSLHARHPNFCKDFGEYFPEITAAIEIMAAEGHASINLMGHSTGALPAALYAKDGERRARIARIIFNSPFLEFREPRWQTRFGAWLGAMLPFARKSNPVNRWYGRSLHSGAKGEWDFNTRLKPLEGFDAYFGWIRAVVNAQERIADGLALPQPILVLHSDRSLDGDEWREEFHRADLILDVADMIARSPRLGSHVTIVEIAGGKHDLTLSQADVVPKVFTAMFDWLAG
jgi:alpha-beta hydrolase superfamily lysophospholipase